jgi:hypothetical protein
MKYIRRRPREKKSVGEWSTPKKIQIEAKLNDFGEVEGQRYYKKRDRRICPKLKGPHQFVQKKQDKYFHSWEDKISIMTEYRCTACNKKKTEFTYQTVDMVESAKTPGCEPGDHQFESGYSPTSKIS